MAAATFLRRLRALTAELAVTSFSDEQAAECLAVADELRACFLPRPTSATPAVSQPAEEQAADLLQLLPPELLAAIMSLLDMGSLARLAATCPSLWRDAPALPTPRAIGPVEAELRQRAGARGLVVSASLPEGAISWVPYLLACYLRDALRRQAPLAVGSMSTECRFSTFVDREDRLLTCGRGMGRELLLGHAVELVAGSHNFCEISSPTLVLSMQGTRIVSVATGCCHCLALSTVGEVYSWGCNSYGELGYLDQDMADTPSRIESLSHIEHIAAGHDYVSAAIDETGNLYTWGRAFTNGGLDNGLGYEVDPQADCQPIPRRVDALLQHRVVSVALGEGFTLVATDGGAVLSFGHGAHGALGHGSSESEVLPRRIEALAQTGRRFVAVAAGYGHGLALTEEGELYGWGKWQHAEDPLHQRVPERFAELVGKQVKLMYAVDSSSCVVTENGELFSWSLNFDSTNHLGHGMDTFHCRPKRVEGLSRVQVAVAAMGCDHTLVADEDGVVWGFGHSGALGLDATRPRAVIVGHPVPIPALRVRVRRSPPPVVPFSVSLWGCWC